MNGADIGKLGVYVHERDASLGTAALEITGDQGNQWTTTTVKLDMTVKFVWSYRTLQRFINHLLPQ
jgi:hypothetical protein